MEHTQRKVQVVWDATALLIVRVLDNAGFIV